MFKLVFNYQVVSKNDCLNFCRYKNKQKSIFNIISLLVEPRNEKKNWKQFFAKDLKLYKKKTKANITDKVC